MAARRGKSQARRNSGNGTPGWVWLVAGAAIAAVAFLAAPNLFKKDGDGFLRAGPQPNPDAQPAPVADADIDAGADLPRPAGRDGATPAEKPAATQYDFYTLLPGKEVQMSDAELAASARAEEQRRAQATRTAQASEAQRAQAALEGRPVPPTAAPLPAPVNEAPRTPAAGEGAPIRTAVAATTPPAAAADAAPKRPEPVAAAPAATSDNVRYILQAGAFGASGDAEATKAKLAMMGLAARVESAQINGNTVYRVRMGPYGTAGELAEAKAKLNGSGLQTMAIKAQ
jgi:cell division protein FtsN